MISRSKYQKKKHEKHYHPKDRISEDRKRERSEQKTPVLPSEAELIKALTYSHTTLGALGETLIAQCLEATGRYRVQINRFGADLTVYDLATGEIIAIEVKTARANGRNKFQFNLIKDRHTDSRKANIVILLCISSAGLIAPFVIPIRAIATNRQCTIPKMLHGKFSHYRQSINALSLEAAIQ